MRRDCAEAGMGLDNAQVSWSGAGGIGNGMSGAGVRRGCSEAWLGVCSVNTLLLRK